ncbi:MAG: hypothetical protein M0Z81_05865 [Deltaproteobacteria bacterium]|nr:hypothetical protein [Deltaproteobacteria bacterium]
MEETSYRLGEYAIIETRDGGIWWKASRIGETRWNPSFYPRLA